MWSRKNAVSCLVVLVVFWLETVVAVFPVFAASAQTRESGEKVSIDFSDVDINEFIKIISELTGKNFIVDRRVKGNITIISPSKISVEEAYRVFESVLEVNGFAMVQADHVTKIIPAPEARSQNIDTGTLRPGESAGDQLATRIIALKYADANEIKRLLTPLVSKGSVILSYSDTNTLIITDILSNIERLVKIIQAVDVMGMGKQVSVIPVEHADAMKLVKNLSTIFTARSQGEKGRTDPDLVVKFVADERTNSVVVLASEVETERVKQLVGLLDRKIPRGDEKIRVYYLEHADAEDLAKVIQEIPSDKNQKTQGKKLTPIISSGVQITADPATNSLIIMAEKEDYPVLEEVISKLDIPRAMVYIECLIMEVNVENGLNLGTEWRVGEGFDNDDGVVFGGFGGKEYTNFKSVASSGSLPSGFFRGCHGGAALHWRVDLSLPGGRGPGLSQ